jgi:hypothetical protein
MYTCTHGVFSLSSLTLGGGGVSLNWYQSSIDFVVPGACACVLNLPWLSIKQGKLLLIYHLISDLWPSLSLCEYHPYMYMYIYMCTCMYMHVRCMPRFQKETRVKGVGHWMLCEMSFELLERPLLSLLAPSFLPLARWTKHTHISLSAISIS